MSKENRHPKRPRKITIDFEALERELIRFFSEYLLLLKEKPSIAFQKRKEQLKTHFKELMYRPENEHLNEPFNENIYLLFLELTDTLESFFPLHKMPSKKNPLFTYTFRHELSPKLIFEPNLRINIEAHHTKSLTESDFDITFDFFIEQKQVIQMWKLLHQRKYRSKKDPPFILFNETGFWAETEMLQFMQGIKMPEKKELLKIRENKISFHHISDKKIITTHKDIYNKKEGYDTFQNRKLSHSIIEHFTGSKFK